MSFMLCWCQRRSIDWIWRIMNGPVQKFTVEHASAMMTDGKTKAHISCGCQEGDIRLTMSRLVLERLRLTINKTLESTPSLDDGKD